MSDREESLLEHGFVLHHRAFRNTSMILDCLTPNYGLIGLVSRGARQARGGQRALLQPFTALRLSWVRRGELGRLTQVEAGPAVPALTGDSLLAGFYLNELLLRLVARGETNIGLFDQYRRSLSELALGERVARTVRLFELALLDALGYRVELEYDHRTGEAIQPGRWYTYEPEAGPTLAPEGRREAALPGEHLISLRDGVLDDSASLQSARRLIGPILDAHVGERPLRSREVMHQVVGRRRSGSAETAK